MDFLYDATSKSQITIKGTYDITWGFALLLNGLMMQFLVIYYGVSMFRDRCINEYSVDDWYLPKVWEWMIKFLCPCEAVVLLIWWMVNSAIQDPDWYHFKPESLISVVLQWVLYFLLFAASVMAVYYLKRDWLESCNPRRSDFKQLDEENVTESSPTINDHVMDEIENNGRNDS